MNVQRTRNGLRLSQHGVVISELRTSPGPTHSVFDLLAAGIQIFAPEPHHRTAVLGFAGGGMMAPLEALQRLHPIDSVDLDRESYELFIQHCPTWGNRVRWHHDEASRWLKHQKDPYDLIVEDLSIPGDGDVFKPEISWTTLPDQIHQALRPGGTAIFNLLHPPDGRWATSMEVFTRRFRAIALIHLDEYENRLLVAGDHLPSPRMIGAKFRAMLKTIRSRQASRMRIEAW